jgi:hypothetical protein
MVTLTSRPLYPREKTAVPIGQGDEWAPQPVWTQWRREKNPSLNLAGIEIRTFSPKTSHCTDRATQLSVLCTGVRLKCGIWFFVRMSDVLNSRELC